MRVYNDFGNLVLGDSRESGKGRGGVSEKVCCELKEAGKVERIFFFNFV